MKSSYELAMERLNKASPMAKLSNSQKKEIAELDSKYAARIAERELFLKGRIAEAISGGDIGAVEELEKQMSSERKALQIELEEKKETVRKSGN